MDGIEFAATPIREVEEFGMEVRGHAPVTPSSDARQGLSSLGFLAGFAAGRVSQIAAHAVMARALGLDGFGLYALGWTILQLGQSIGHLGLSEGVVRYLPRYRNKEPARVRSILARALGLSGLAGGVLAAVLLLTSEALAERIFGKPGVAPVFLAFVPALAVAPVMQVAAAATRATTIMRHSILSVEVGLPVLILVAALGLWLTGSSAPVMALATSIAFVAITAVALVQVWGLYRAELTTPPVTALEPDRLLPFSLAALSMSATLVLMLWSDRLFVGAFRPAAEVGAYHAASQISMLLVIVFQPLSAVLAPFAAAAAWESRHGELKHSYQNLYRWSLYLAAPAAFLALEFADLILVLLYGPGFAIATQPARVLIAGQLFYLLGGAAGALLVMTGRERLWLAHASAAVLINLALNALLVPRHGMLGAATATAIALTVFQGGGCLLVRWTMGFWPLSRPLATALAVGVSIMGLGMGVVHGLIAAPDVWLRALPPVVGVLALLAVVIGTKAYHDDAEILALLRRSR
jgi:O-antigen/teichoic acid export membrane protein